MLKNLIKILTTSLKFTYPFWFNDYFNYTYQGKNAFNIFGF